MVKLDSGARSTVVDLKEVFDTDPSTGGVSDAALRAYLNAAHDVVEARLSGEGLDSGTLERLEKFLAADFATAQDPLVKSEQVADVQATYQRVDDGTDYGRIVRSLDPTGKLAGIGGGTANIETYGPGR